MECDSLLDSYFYVFYENKNEVEKKIPNFFFSSRENFGNPKIPKISKNP